MKTLLALILSLSSTLAFAKNLSHHHRRYASAVSHCAYSGGVFKILFCGSPLVIQMDQTPLELTSRENGVRFNLMNRSEPQRIAWLTARSAQSNVFLVLPNAKNEVTGSQELFGDQTLGPDGEKSANGFEALRKYDQNQDGRIDKTDPVYRELAVWSDTNANGVAENGELHSLAEAGIDTISLAYDPNYSRADQFGNEIRYASSVKTREGVEHGIYDVWLQGRFESTQPLVNVGYIRGH